MAAIPLVALTGDQLVRLATNVQKGQVVLVTGALGVHDPFFLTPSCRGKLVNCYADGNAHDGSFLVFEMVGGDAMV